VQPRCWFFFGFEKWKKETRTRSGGLLFLQKFFEKFKNKKPCNHVVGFFSVLKNGKKKPEPDRVVFCFFGSSLKNSKIKNRGTALLVFFRF